MSIPPDYRQLFHLFPGSYLLLTPDGTVVDQSDAHVVASQRTRAQTIGQPFLLAFPMLPATAQAIADSLAEVRRTGQPHTMPLVRHDVAPPAAASGGHSEQYWRPQHTPLFDAQGELLYILQHADNVTPQVLAERQAPLHVARAEQQLQVLNEALEATNRELLTARAEAENQRSQLHNVLMQAPAMIAIFKGPAHTFRLVNPQYQQLVGNRPLLDKPIREAMPELVGQPIFGLLDQVYRTGETFYATEMLVQLDHANTGTVDLGQRYYNFIYQASRSLAGAINGIIVFAYEVTEQVRARRKVEYSEQALQSANEELAAINEDLQAANEEFLISNTALVHTQQALQQLNHELEQRVGRRTLELQRAQAEAERQRARLERFFMQAPAGICILDGPELVFELVNPSYQQLFPGRELLGKPVLSALPEIADQPIWSILQQVYQTGKLMEGSEVLVQMARHQDGPLENIYFNFIYQPRHDEHGHTDGVLAFAYDVTEQVMARQAVAQANG